MKAITIKSPSGETATVQPGDSLTIGTTEYEFDELQQLFGGDEVEFTVTLPEGKIDRCKTVKRADK